MATESIGTLIPTAIPGYTDSADIQAALRAYHYGSYAYDPANTSPGSLVTPSIAKTIYDIQADITTLENRPSSGGEVDATQPAPGDFTPPEIPDGFIWVDSDGTVGGQPTSATSVFTNSAPTSSLTTGVIWVDKDPTSITVNPFIPQTIIGAKGDIVVGTANDTASVLNAGTNGFVLSANSATTSGLEWVAQDDSNAIQNSIVAAKGDIIGASANDVPAITSVGADGTTLVADSSTSTGLRYQSTQAAGKNYLINGGFDIWQRGTSGFTSNAYTADRWQAALNSGTFTVSLSTDVPTSPYFNYSLSMAGTSAQNMQIFQNIESANATLFAGQTVTLSVWAKNSAGTTKLSYVGLYPTAVDNFTTSTTDVSGDLTATSWSGSWTKYSVTFTANALATRGYKIIFYRNGTETSTTLFTGIQLEFGSVATAFTRAGGTIQGELAACQRYYYRTATGGQLWSLFSQWGTATSSTLLFSTVVTPVTMRITPSSVDFASLRVFGQSTGVYNSISAVALDGAASSLNLMQVQLTSSGMTTNSTYGFGGNNSATAYIAFNSEL